MVWNAIFAPVTKTTLLAFVGEGDVPQKRSSQQKARGRMQTRNDSQPHNYPHMYPMLLRVQPYFKYTNLCMFIKHMCNYTDIYTKIYTHLEIFTYVCKPLYIATHVYTHVATHMHTHLHIQHPITIDRTPHDAECPVFVAIPCL